MSTASASAAGPPGSACGPGPRSTTSPVRPLRVHRSPPTSSRTRARPVRASAATSPVSSRSGSPAEAISPARSTFVSARTAVAPTGRCARCAHTCSMSPAVSNAGCSSGPPTPAAAANARATSSVERPSASMSTVFAAPDIRRTRALLPLPAGPVTTRTGASPSPGRLNQRPTAASALGRAIQAPSTPHPLIVARLVPVSQRFTSRRIALRRRWTRLLRPRRRASRRIGWPLSPRPFGPRRWAHTTAARCAR